MRKHFDFYAYCSPTSGKYKFGDCEYDLGEDFRTAERYKEYKDVGFNILLLQHENTYNGEEFIGSACHKCMSEAYKAGINKIIVSDGRLKDLCSMPEPVFGNGGRFADECEFLSYLDMCTKPYRNQKGFYGIQLYDEPQISLLDNYGTVCKGLKKLFPDIYLQCNLLPLANNCLLGYTGDKVNYEAYGEYLNQFLDVSDMDSILFDEYWFRCRYIMCGYTLRTFQIAADICKKRKKELRAVLQSFACVDRGKLVHRQITERDMRMQINLAMGFGVKEYSFFTYFTKPFMFYKDDGLAGDALDGAAMVNRDGSRTKLYYAAQNAIAEIKKFEPVLLSYDFDESYLFFSDGKTNLDYEHTELALVGNNCPITVKPTCGIVLVTRLVRADSALYMIENISNIKDEMNGGEIMKAEIDFGGTLSRAKEINFYSRSERVDRKIANGKLTETLPCGEALFIEIIG